MQLIWGVDLVALLWAFVTLAKPTLDKVVFANFTLTQWLLGVSLGLGSLLARYADVIAAWSPIPAEILNGAAAFLVPLFVFLGVWKPVVGAAIRVSGAVKAKLWNIYKNNGGYDK